MTKRIRGFAKQSVDTLEKVENIPKNIRDRKNHILTIWFKYINKDDTLEEVKKCQKILEFEEE